MDSEPVWYKAIKDEGILRSSLEEWLATAEAEALNQVANAPNWEKFCEAKGGLQKVRDLRNGLTAKEREENAVGKYLREAH